APLAPVCARTPSCMLAAIARQAMRARVFLTIAPPFITLRSPASRPLIGASSVEGDTPADDRHPNSQRPEIVGSEGVRIMRQNRQVGVAADRDRPEVLLFERGARRAGRHQAKRRVHVHLLVAVPAAGRNAGGALP